MTTLNASQDRPSQTDDPPNGVESLDDRLKAAQLKKIEHELAEARRRWPSIEALSKVIISERVVVGKRIPQ